MVNLSGGPTTGATRWADVYAKTFFAELGTRVSARYCPYIDLKHPLLQRLSQKIPGTFLHSVLVGFACAIAAHAIKADADVARVIGYYHDVSKLENPQFFVEAVSGNRGAKLQEVASIRQLGAILDHPKASARQLQQYGFPSEIIRAVVQHHGTVMTRITLTHALRERVLAEGPEYLRYPGPVPRSKEAAILMLADCSESRFHSLWRSNTDKPSEIENFVELVRAIGRELRNGRSFEGRMIEPPQLNDSGLSIVEQSVVEYKIAEALFRFYHDLDVINTPLHTNGDPVFDQFLPVKWQGPNGKT